MLAVIESIYDAVGKRDGWKTALAMIGQAMAADLVAIVQLHQDGGEPRGLMAVNGPVLPPAELYRALCRRMPVERLRDGNEGEIVPLSPPPRGPEPETPAPCPPATALGVALLREPARILIAVVGRSASRPVFSPSDRDGFALIARHLAKAVRQSFMAQASAIDRVNDHLAFVDLPQPMFLVDAAVRMLDANGAAKRLLEAGVLHLSPTGVLVAADHAAGDDLASCVGHVLADREHRGRLVIHRRNGRPLTARVLPSGWASHCPTALVMIYDPDHHHAVNTALLQEGYRLTRAEARVVGELLYAPTLPTIATRLNMSYATARTHLARVFEKTRASSQAELVSLVLRGGLA